MQTKLLTTSALALYLTSACIHTPDNLQLNAAPVPASDLEKHSIVTSKNTRLGKVEIDFDYNIIMRSGDKPNGSVAAFGTLFDIEGKKITNPDGSVRISNDNDFSSLVMGDDEEVYMISHFESRPAAMYITQMNQDKNSGDLTAKKTRPLDFSHLNGGWVHCAGSVAPWGNHIGSEEYPPNAKQWRDNQIENYNAAMVRYLPNARGAKDTELPALARQYMNPYDYGYTIEVDVKDYENTSVVKHYAMGRIAVELSYVMPDETTVYTSDDGSYVGFFRFQADRKRDLSSGELYAAKFKQTSPWFADNNDHSHSANGGKGELSWISLGKATDAEIRAIIDSGVTFSDIFTENEAGCTTIEVGYGKECLTIKTGMDKAASRLETRRYAALKGATIEWEKMEGITHDQSTNTLYLAMSVIEKGMSDGKGDISVPLNRCGTVYALDLDAHFLAKNMYGVASGIPRTIKNAVTKQNIYPQKGSDTANQCDVNAIAGPDNITYIPALKSLIIAEDNDTRQNNMLWAFNIESKKMSRILTAPSGSEVTSPYFYHNLNGFNYLMTVIQYANNQPDNQARGYTGYMGPWKGLLTD